MPVKPLTVVTKIGVLLADGVPMSLAEQMSYGTGEKKLTWRHEDCVTLADAERYAREKVEEAIERERWPKSVPESEIVQPSLNHGSFYLETQADLVLRARVNDLEKRVAEMERK